DGFFSWDEHYLESSTATQCRGLHLRHALGRIIDPLTDQNATVLRLVIRSTFSQALFNERICQEPVTQFSRFKGCLIPLGRGEYVNAFFVRKLGESLGFHWPSTFLFRLQCLATVASIDDHQKVPGINALERRYQLLI